ncbi:MAG: hypothetical protein ACKOCD_09250 [Nitrospiraceae bacterium]
MPGSRAPQPWQKIAPRPSLLRRRPDGQMQPSNQKVRPKRPTGPILFLLASLLSGCASGAAPSNESHRTAPDPQTIGYVWGDHDLAVDVAGAWLHNRGYKTVEAEKAKHTLAAGSITLTGSSSETASLLRLAPALGADFLVFVDVTIMPLAFRRPATDEAAAAPHIEAKQSIYRVHVAVQGIDAHSGEVAWNGEARRRLSHSSVHSPQYCSDVSSCSLPEIRGELAAQKPPVLR